MLKKNNIQGYIWKNRNALTTNQFYISLELNSTIHPKKAIEIIDFDVLLIDYISKGLHLEDISKKLKEKRAIPSSVSAVQKD